MRPFRRLDFIYAVSLLPFFLHLCWIQMVLFMCVPQVHAALTQTLGRVTLGFPTRSHLWSGFTCNRLSSDRLQVTLRKSPSWNQALAGNDTIHKPPRGGVGNSQ